MRPSQIGIIVHTNRGEHQECLKFHHLAEIGWYKKGLPKMMKKNLELEKKMPKKEKKRQGFARFMSFPFSVLFFAKSSKSPEKRGIK